MSNKRSLALLGASSLLLSILPAAALAQTPAKNLEKLELSADKVKDSVEISSLWASRVGKAEHVLVTTDAVFADSLASGALQGSAKAPLLFVDAKAGLDEQTVKTITGLGAKKVTVLGGEQAISKEIAEALGKVAGVTEVARVSGESRVETSVALAELTKAKDDTIIVARADDYADSLAAGALAARTGYPVVLAPKPYKAMEDKKEVEVVLHPAVEAYIKKAGIKKIIVAGGPEAVADPTFAALKALVSDTTRAAGESRRETAVELAKLWKSTGKVTVVDGYSDVNGFHNGFASALAASNLGAPVILSNKAEKPSEAELALAGPNADGVTGYCGTYVDSAFCKTVSDKQGAAVKAVKLAESDAILPLKVTPGDLAKLVGAEKNAPTRAYEVADAKADAEYTIKLAKGKKDEKGNIVLDLGTDEKPQDSKEASIATVNGAKSGSPNNVKVKAVAGKISFSIEANVENGNGYVIPVLTAVEDGKDKLVGMGGPVHISPVAVENGKYLGDNDNKTNNWTVESVDKEAKTIVVVSDDKAVKRTLTYKENDIIYSPTVSPNNRVDFATFVKELSTGDEFVASKDPNGTLYYGQPSLASTLVWVDAAPKMPDVKASTKTAATQDSITLKLTDVEDKADVTVKLFKLTPTGDTMNGLNYKGNEEKFTVTKTFPAVKKAADGTVEVTVTGLDADSKYDFAVSQKVGEETSDFGDFGAAGANAVPANALQTTKQPEPLAIASVERVGDVVNDGDGSATSVLKLTLSSDKFDDGDIVDLATKKLITVEAKTGGVVEVVDAGQDAAGTDNKIGKDANSKTVYLKLGTALKDVANDIEYTVKIQQGAFTTTSANGEKPNTPAEFKFMYR